MADNSSGDYRAARLATGVLLFILVVVIELLDAFRTDFEVNPLVLVPILIAGLALFAVDAPALGNLMGRRSDNNRKDDDK